MTKNNPNDRLSVARRIAGFTLVELLVVISIIALLLAVLMPALQNAREQGKSVVCLSNIKQWNSIFVMYTGENKGKFWVDGPVNPSAGIANQGIWMGALSDYYQNIDKIRMCPSATKFDGTGVGGTSFGWGGRDLETGAQLLVNAGFSSADGQNHKLYGSYGTNLWISSGTGWGSHPDWQWATMASKDTARIPMMGDCTWFGVHPTDTTDRINRLGSAVPKSADYFKKVGGDWATMMARVSMPRHNKRYVNWGFMDCSSRRVMLPELWTLKWHRQYVSNPNIKISWLR